MASVILPSAHHSALTLTHKGISIESESVSCSVVGIAAYCLMEIYFLN